MAVPGYLRYSFASYLSLTRAFAVSDFKLRFHGSKLGVLWSFFRPLLMFGTLYLVFSVFMRFDIPNYPFYLLLGIILWNFFAEATMFSIASIDSKAPLVRKVYFPRTIIAVSATLTSLIALLFNLVVFFLLLFISGLSISFSAFSFLFFIVLLFFTTLGASFFVSSLFPKFRDIRPIWEVFLQLGFWVTPIIYAVSMVPAHYHTFIFLNPIARIVEYSREALLYGQGQSLADIAVLGLLVATVFVFGFVVYKRQSRTFAEEI